MRTTLTLDDDVAIAIERLRRQTGERFKEIVNGLLREALAGQPPARPRGKPFRTASHASGRCLVDSLDDISKVLALAEGEDHR